jgi:hypothetical protein
MTVFSRTPLAVTAMVAALAIVTSQARAQEDDATEEVTAEDEEAPVGLAVDGVIRSNRGGFAFPDGSRMTGPPSLSLGGPYECAPPAGESRSCVIEERWDLCSLSGMAMSRFNAFVEPSCIVAKRSDGSWSIEVESSGQFVIRCQATCLSLGL